MTTASVREVREKGYGEKAEEKLVSCETISSLMELDEDELKFNDELGSNVPSQTSLREERIEFSANYLADRRDDSFQKFQDALIHEASHLNDIRRWKDENIHANQRFIKLFKFFSEGLASQFDNKENSYPAAEKFFRGFYEDVSDLDEDYTPGDVLMEKSEEVDILCANYKMDESVKYSYQVVETHDNEISEQELYRKAEKDFKNRYPDKEISLIEEKTEKLDIKKDEAEVLAKHYKEAYEDTREILSEYIEKVEKETGRRIDADYEWRH